MVFRCSVFKSAWPATRDLFPYCGTSVGITLAITLTICSILKWTGFFESQFYRLSNRDYGQAEELGLVPEGVPMARNSVAGF